MEQRRIEEYTDEGMVAGFPSFGRVKMRYSDREALIGPMMTACGEKHESCTPEKGVRGMNNIIVHLVKVNEVEFYLFPKMTIDLIKNEGTKFKELLKSMKPRLLEMFSEVEVD